MTAWDRSEQALPIGVEEKLPIAALHQFEPETGEADSAIAQIVCLPAAFGQPGCVKQSDGDFAVGSAIKASIKCAQSVGELVPLRLSECGLVRAGFTVTQRK